MRQKFIYSLFIIIGFLSGVLLSRAYPLTEAQERKKEPPIAICSEIFDGVLFEGLTGLINSRIDDVGKFGYKLEKQSDGTYRVFFIRDSPCAETTKE